MNAAVLESPARTIAISPVPVSSRTATTPVGQIRTLCSSCHLKDLCLPCGLTGPEVERLDSLMFARRRVAFGETLFHEGYKFHAG